MKRKFSYLLLIIILLGFSNCEKKTQQILYDSRYKKEIAELRKEASVYLSLNNIPGASIAVSKNGKIIYSEGMGLASKDLEVPVTRKTKFRIGEVSEIFTSLIYQMMIDKGILHPDSSVQHYLPEYPHSPYRETLNRITLNQLASHSSGIRKRDDDSHNWNGKNLTLLNNLDNFKNEQLDFYPGWFETPSSDNYNLLGAIMETATGKKFPQLLTEYITDSLELTNTEVDNPFKTVSGRTDFFDYNLVSQVVGATFADMRYRSPSVGILSNAEDLVKLGNAILYSDKISQVIQEKVFELTDLLGDFPPSIANGWIVQKNAAGERYFGKVGSTIGGGAIILIIPEEKLSIAVTTNLTSIGEIPVFKLLEPFLSKSDTNKKEINNPE